YNKFKVNRRMTHDYYKNIIRDEQEDFMARMSKPPQVAENEALLENVLVMIVCILTKIPVFVIGAPGASKSLAIRLVSQNLRGGDSDDSYFRTLPQVYVIPYQGSSSSTSDGVVKVFKKAEEYQKTNSKDFPLITVVLLDEVGLAETSPHNPLKVLHSLLEPSYPQEFPNVSVIGISNWRLDNSKSSRALLIQRPKFEGKDLEDTAHRLLIKSKSLRIFGGNNKILHALSDSYLEYEKKQPIKNFHGLRDYYSLVKSLSSSEDNPESTQMALARNFGGTNNVDQLCEKHFGSVIKAFHGKTMKFKNFSAEELIKANLEDNGARHLMIIGKSDSIVNLLTYKLQHWSNELSRKRDFLGASKITRSSAWDMEPVVIYGSQFPNDFDDDYQYSVLSRIMMCVEAGRPLILTDLEIIYGSLYDLWNQNYITVGRDDNQKFYTRVALGAYSNPMVCVHENFRCILVLDEKKVDFADPPLLNRFEKQKMSINDTLDDRMSRLVKELSTWCKQISNFVKKGNFAKSEFKERDTFVGFDPEETLQSLVIHNCTTTDLADEEILVSCKEMLINIASADGIIRSRNSGLSVDIEEIERWKNVYFHEQHHDNIATYIRSLLDENLMKGQGFKTVINTFSNINTDIASCLSEILTCQVDKISTFKSEAQLTARIKHFWFESNADMLILQCDLTAVSAGCIKLAKFIIEQLQKEFMISDENPIVKHVCIILHMMRENEATTTSFNFMCGWKLVTIENLTSQGQTLTAYLDNSLNEILEHVYPFKEIISQELLWCLLCMKFPSTPESVDYIKLLVQEIPKHEEFLDCLRVRTLEWLGENVPEDWLLQVASNKKDLYLYSSFSVSLQTYIRNQVRKPISKLLCVLERMSGLSPLFIKNDQMHFDDLYAYDPPSDELFEFWKKVFMDSKIVNIEYLLDSKPDLYQIPARNHNTRFPFSTYYMDQINKFKKLYQEDLSVLEDDENNYDEMGELRIDVIESCIERFTENVCSVIPLLKSPKLFEEPEIYFKDFVTVALPKFGKYNKDGELLRWIILYHLGQQIPNPVRLHVFWWGKSESVLAELQMMEMCPEVIKTITSMKNDEIRNLDFEAYLLEEVVNVFMNRIYSINDKSAPEQMLHTWQRDVTNLLSLATRLLIDVNGNQSLQRLRIYNDLSKSLKLQDLLEIRKIEVEEESEEMLSKQFIDNVFKKLASYDKNELSLSSQRSFINRCLNTLSIESPIRLLLYTNN
ncbi:7269_t:CDS:2, partial [Acaulospora morrowiae]